MESDATPRESCDSVNGHRPPKVAVVCHSHPTLTQGGAEIASYALFRGLRQVGVDAIFISACNVSDRHKLTFADRNEFAIYYDGERREYFYNLAPQSVVDQLVRIVREEEVEVVNFHHFLNFGLNSLRAVRLIPGVRCFYTIHEFLAICQNHGQMITRPAQILCEEATTERCVTCFPEHVRSEFVMRKETALNAIGEFAGFVCPSRFLADRFIKWGLSGDRTVVIENGLRRTAQVSRKTKKSALWTFGFFGQINPFKGVDVILDAAERLAGEEDLVGVVRFRIHGNLVGQSPKFESRLKKALKKYPFITYSGPYNNESVRRLMSECDYVVVPSKWWENSPLVIQEAFAAGVPVICSGIGGMAEKVQDGVSGLHFLPGDSADLLRAVRTAASVEQAAALCAGIPQVPSAEEMANNYMAFFESHRQTVPPTHLVNASIENDPGTN